MNEKKQKTLGIGLVIFLLMLNIIFFPIAKKFPNLDIFFLRIDCIGILVYLFIVAAVCYKHKKKS